MEYVRNARAADLDNGAAVELAVPVAARTGFKRICQANSAVGYGKVIYMLVPGNYVFGMPELADGIKNAVILRVFLRSFRQCRACIQGPSSRRNRHR